MTTVSLLIRSSAKLDWIHLFPLQNHRFVSRKNFDLLSSFLIKVFWLSWSRRSGLSWGLAGSSVPFWIRLKPADHFSATALLNWMILLFKVINIIFCNLSIIYVYYNYRQFLWSCFSELEYSSLQSDHHHLPGLSIPHIWHNFTAAYFDVWKTM